MKIKYQTSRETAVVLREMASNCGSHAESLIGAGMAGFVQRLEIESARPVECFMDGQVEVEQPTAEAVIRSFQNCRSFRAKTIARLAPTIQITWVSLVG